MPSPLVADRRAVRFALAAVVTLGIVSATHRTIALRWSAMTEEFPYAQEVLRFLSGDFRQQFFDIPGTPFMGLVTILFAPIAAMLSAASGGNETLAATAFEHLQWMYWVMRVVSLAAFAGATCLVFNMARRFASEPAALVGAAIFALHPILALTLYHTRIEPFGTLLVSASIVAWLRAIETGRWGWYAATGLLAGLAMAARFPLLTASLPVFVFYGLVRPVPLDSRANLATRSLAAALMVVALGGGGLAAATLTHAIDRNALTDAIFVSASHGGFPRATATIAWLWVVIGSATGTVLLVAATAAGRRLVRRYVDSGGLTTAVFFPVGLVAGVPTLFAGADYFLGSIENFIGRNAFNQPGMDSDPLSVVVMFAIGQEPLRLLFDLRHVLDPLRFLTSEPGVAFNLPLVILFCAGFAARPADRLLYWSVRLACVAGIVSQLEFGKLQTTRHIAGWLPWFCIVFAVGTDRFLNRNLRRPVLAAIVIAFVIFLGRQGAALSATEIDHLVEKAQLQSTMVAWLRANTTADDATFHTCCEPITPGVIFAWMKQNGVDVPAKYLDESTIWFGEQSVLRRTVAGFVVTSRHTFPGQYLEYYRQMNPKELVDPYHDPRFELRHTVVLPGSKNLYDIFSFDMSGHPRLVSGGIAVREATYGESCRGTALPRGHVNKVATGNLTREVRRACNRRLECDFVVGPEVAGDPAPFCAKDFVVSWTCGDNGAHEVRLPAEAAGSTVHLSCTAAERPAK